jgi:hypothetical protein
MIEDKIQKIKMVHVPLATVRGGGGNHRVGTMFESDVVESRCCGGFWFNFV